MEAIDIFVMVLIVLLLFMPVIAIRFERKWFNKGVCPDCGEPLHYFDTDSQGGRGYLCNKCNYHCWVSYNCVDKEFRNR